MPPTETNIVNRNILVRQRLRVISHESLVFSQENTSEKWDTYFIPCNRNKCDIRATHDGKVGYTVFSVAWYKIIFFHLIIWFTSDLILELDVRESFGFPHLILDQPNFRYFTKLERNSFRFKELHSNHNLLSCKQQDSSEHCLCNSY